VRRLRSNFVCVALNLRVLRKDKGLAAEFYRSLQKQRPKMYQGIYVVSPSGKVLGSQDRAPEKGSWPRALARVLDEAEESFGEVMPRAGKPFDALPHRGKGHPPGGGGVIAVYARAMRFRPDLVPFGTVVIDSARLSAAEWSSLTRPGLAEGDAWSVPAATVRKLHGVLSPSSDQSSLAIPEEVTEAVLKVSVERVRGGVASLAIEARLASVHTYLYEPHKGKKVHAEMELRGVGTADAKTGALRSLTLVGQGIFRNHPPYDERLPFGAVVEWRDRP
jgi:hypothetical protein